MDGLNNLISVNAIGNPKKELCKETRLCTLQDKSSGHGIIRFNKEKREITFEAWKLVFDANNPQPDDQYPGWPKTVSMYTNYGREAAAWLPTVQVKGISDPVVQLIDEKTKETVYTVRAKGQLFAPKVFAKGSYTLKVGDPEQGKMKTKRNIKSLDQKGDDVLVFEF